jgi:hypothetical protein
VNMMAKTGCRLCHSLSNIFSVSKIKCNIMCVVFGPFSIFLTPILLH